MTQLIHSILRKDTAKNILNRSTLLIALCLLSGLLFRLFLASFAVKDPLYDQYVYLELAGKIAGGKIATDCCTKGPGYSIFIAIIYHIIGTGNYPPVRTIQIFIDLGTAVLLYLTAKKIFDRKAAFFSFLAYIFNPFTGPYTGLLLPEIITLFYIALISYIISKESFNKSPKSWFILGFILGLLFLTRISFLYFILGFMPLLYILTHKGPGQFRYLPAVLSGFVIVSSYILIGNMISWQKISIMPPYSLSLGGLYANFDIQGYYPEIIADPASGKPSPDSQKITDEYSLTPQNQWKDLENKYKTLFWERLQREWPLFIRSKIRSAIMLWDKRYLYYYYDPIYPKYSRFVRMYNIILLTIAAWGFYSFLRKKDKKKEAKVIVYFTVYLFLYLTIFTSLLSNESRHSLPFYVLIFLWSGYSIDVVIKRLLILLK